MERKKVDVIIPTYRPGTDLVHLLQRLQKQDYPVHKILIMNTEEAYWNRKWEAECDILEVHHLTKESFDHGGTRKAAAALSDSEIMIFMTQDALPADKHLISSLLKPFEENDKTGAVYARQLPNEQCSFLERYTRSFNYPETSYIRTKDDLPVYGIKTFFCSNVCAAYRKDIYEEMGGFVERTIFNEDMIFAGTLVQNGYGIGYAADAKVIHSHNYSAMQQFHRNFDLGVSQAEHPEIFANVPSEGEGIRLVKKTMVYLCKKGRFWLIPKLVIHSGSKYAGYFLGKRYRRLPKKVILWCTMNREYWKHG